MNPLSEPFDRDSNQSSPLKDVKGASESSHPASSEKLVKNIAVETLGSVDAESETMKITENKLGSEESVFMQHIKQSHANLPSLPDLKKQNSNIEKVEVTVGNDSRSNSRTPNPHHLVSQEELDARCTEIMSRLDQLMGENQHIVELQNELKTVKDMVTNWKPENSFKRGSNASNFFIQAATSKATADEVTEFQFDESPAYRNRPSEASKSYMGHDQITPSTIF